MVETTAQQTYKDSILRRISFFGAARHKTPERPYRVCFFAHVDDPRKLQHVGFYAQDIRALEDLGFEVCLATSWRQIPWNADLYFVWWWTWAFLPMLKARLRRKPVIITGTFNLSWGAGDYYHRPLLQRLIVRAMVRMATINILVSLYEAEPMRQLGWSKSIKYSPHCVDTSLYVPGLEPRDDDLMVTIGWLREENARRKGMFDIIHAMPDILRARPSARLVIVGEHDTGYGPLLHLAQELEVDHAISWPGQITEEQKLHLLQTCAVYLQPSVYEGFGLAILEAMSCGCPIVTRSVGAVPEVVGAAAAFVDGSPADLTRTVVRLLDAPIMRERLGMEGRARAVAEFGLSRRRLDLDTAIGEAKRRFRQN